MSAIEGTTELERLVNRSRLIGANPALVVHGGGNTSSKLVESDHLGRPRRALRIKGSGTDLAGIDAGGFPGLYLDELLALRERAAMSDAEMVAYLARCMIEPDAPRPSIETLLHAFLPAAHVDHVHADAICCLSNGPDGEAAIAAALGGDVAVVPYVRPGFALAKLVASQGDRRAVVLAHHGLVTWGETHEESYGLTLELVARAEEHVRRSRRPSAAAVQARSWSPDDLERLLVGLRGRLSRDRHVVLRVDREQAALADRADVARIADAGRATPDHTLRIGPWSAVVRAADDVEQVVAAFEERYRAYFDRHRDLLPPGLGMLDPLPRVALVPGLGCVAAGADARSARVRSEIAHHSHEVAAAALDLHGSVEWLDERDLFDFEYWPLELYKLTLAPEPPELAGRVAIVTGAASGIGRGIAIDLARRGAHVVLADVDQDGLAETAAAVPAEQTVLVAGDLTDERTVDRLVGEAVRSFGGLDAVVSNAGIATGGTLAELSPQEWRRSIEVNATSHFLLTRRAWPVLERQGIGGSLVYVASKNAFGPGAGFGAYSAAKAAEIQVARIAALEGGSIGVRANAVNPDAIFAGSALWSPELRAERAAAHGVRPDELEDFYARRNLLRQRVRVEDVAETVAFLVSDRSRATTGCVVTVDGGVAAAFPR